MPIAQLLSTGLLTVPILVFASAVVIKIVPLPFYLRACLAEQKVQFLVA